MQSLSINTTNQSQPLFEIMVRDVEPLLVDQMDDKTILASLRVCKAWHSNQALQKHLSRIKEDAWYKQEGYPIEIVKAFRDNGVSIWRLPELNLSQLYPNFNRDYIDYIRPDDMPAPVMRFNRHGHSGIAFKLIEQEGSDVELLILFKRQLDQPHWKECKSHFGTKSLVSLLELPLHRKSQDHIGDMGSSCPNCPAHPIDGFQVMPKWVSTLLSHKFVHYGLAGPVQMIDRPPPGPPPGNS